MAHGLGLQLVRALGRRQGEDAMRFAFVLFRGLEELDLVGPWEMVGMWAKAGQGPDERLQVAETKEPVHCANGMIVEPHTTFAECPQLDYLLVPGGEGARDLAATEGVVRFLAERAKECKAVLSVCTGSLLLRRAGLLSGRQATTHWSRLEELRSYPGIRVVEERFTEDGSVWTSAGVSAGIDMTLAFIARVAGDATAGRVQLGAEYYPSGKRYGGVDRHPKAPAYVQSTEAKSSPSGVADEG
jgi:transcriptional regulator GlxA family with amidase domain